MGYLGGEEGGKGGDEDLRRRIMEAKVLIPRINSMRVGSRAIKKLEARLNKLAAQLGLEEVSSDVSPTLPELSAT